ncbi:hypothetical protein E2320_016176, partial [Naja naja]
MCPPEIFSNLVRRRTSGLLKEAAKDELKGGELCAGPFSVGMSRSSVSNFLAVSKELISHSGRPDASWQLLTNIQGLCIYRLYDEKSGLYEYKIYSILNDCSPELCAEVYMDLNYRTKWDQYVKKSVGFLMGLVPMRHIRTSQLSDSSPSSDYSLEEKHEESFGRVPGIQIARSHLGPTPDRADVSRDESPPQAVRSVKKPKKNNPPSSPNAAKRLYRNLSEKLKGSHSSFDEVYFRARTDRLSLRKSSV